jgi:hypothetical protein
VVLPLTTPTAPKKGLQEDTMVNNPSQDILEKIVGRQLAKHRKKATMVAALASLEVHQSPSSFDHVSTIFLYSNSLFVRSVYSYIILLCSP